MKNNYQPSANSLKHTFCVFTQVPLSEIEGLALQFESKAGSRYYYTKKGMYRFSNHWGRLANSKWRLVATIPDSTSKYKLGFASWNTFYPDNNTDCLYYLVVDYATATIAYEHKNNPEYDGKALLRTSVETTKRIKQARNILELHSWKKHFETADIEAVKRKIIDALIHTNKTLDLIKRESGEQA
jgi:hypothetical protein